jgi:NAD(P)H-nitrite reductase large subunit
MLYLITLLNQNLRGASTLIMIFPKKDDIIFTEDILKAPLGERVCYCANVSKDRILAAIQEGAHSLEEIKMATGACTAGNCKELSPRKR